MKVGNKAASLLEMKELGFPVPDFFILSTDFFQQYKKNPQENITAEVRAFLSSHFDSSHQGTWAVRSSSNKEDGQNFSFAGLFETYLGLSKMSEIENAILNCWKSTNSERVLNYAEKKGINAHEIEMAVIVQKFIEPDYAGVLFTCHPLSGNDQEMFLEICKGRGENLVSGHVTPDQVRFSWESPLRILEHKKQENITISKKILEQLQTYAQQLQAHYGYPLDIEFAVQNEQLFILQSRPITKIQFAENEEEWTTADFRDGGVSSDVVSPLMWSLYEKIFSSSLPEYFYKIKLTDRKFIEQTTWYKVFYGRPYWNLKAVKDIMSQVPEFNEKNFDEDMSIPITYDGNGRVTPLTLIGILKVLPAVFALESEFNKQHQRSQNLLENFQKIESYYQSLDLSQISDQELINIFKKLIFTDYTYVESEYFQTIYNASNAKMEFLSSLKKLQKIDPTLDYIKLISNLGAIEATQPAFELTLIAEKYQNSEAVARLDTLVKNDGPIHENQLGSLPADLQKELVQFTKRFYYHSERELDLRVPRWNEDYRFILTTLLQIFNTYKKNSSLDHLKNQVHNNELVKAQKAFEKSSQRWIPGSWKNFTKKLDRVRSFLKMREEIRCHSTKMYYFIRLMTLEIARRKLPTSAQHLIFYVPYSQIIILLENSISVIDFISKAQQMKNYADGFRNYRNPNETGYRYNFIGQRTSDFTASENTLKGIGCSVGTIRAKARVVSDIQEARYLQSGEILVTRFTDPGWTPLFSLASGVVCENGGLLSHAALISREYGIPSVLNVKDATSIIKNGQDIEVDGLRGEVSLL